MSLGANRDYKTADRRARTQLAKHFEIMEYLISIGNERETASRKAFKAMEEGYDLELVKMFAKDSSWGALSKPPVCE